VGPEMLMSRWATVYLCCFGSDVFCYGVSAIPEIELRLGLLYFIIGRQSLFVRTEPNDQTGCPLR
jgi:hypothetical protein